MRQFPSDYLYLKDGNVAEKLEEKMSQMECKTGSRPMVVSWKDEIICNLQKKKDLKNSSYALVSEVILKFLDHHINWY